MLPSTRIAALGALALSRALGLAGCSSVDPVASRGPDSSTLSDASAVGRDGEDTSAAKTERDDGSSRDARAGGDSGPSEGGPVAEGGTSPEAGPSPTGPFYIVGKDIVDPDGNKFFPFGGNVGIKAKKNGNLETSYAFDFGGAANGHSDDAVAWGWNVIRLNIPCYRSDGYETAQQIADSIDAIVTEYTAKKIVVMPECTEDTGKTLPLTDTAMMAGENVWNLVMPAYKNNPYVWFNPFNEATDDASNATQLTYWSSLQKHYIDKCNALGSENIIVADFPGYGQGAAQIGGTDLGTHLVANQCNVLLSWHAYGGSGDADTAQYETWIQQIQDKNIAFLFGEYGYTIDMSGNPNIPWTAIRAATEKVLAIGAQKGIGGIVWHGTGDSHGALSFSLMANYQTASGAAFFNGSNGQGLSELGQKVWDRGHSKPALGAFAESYAPSHCASAPL